jgi:hypothetical protein
MDATSHYVQSFYSLESDPHDFIPLVPSPPVPVIHVTVLVALVS